VNASEPLVLPYPRLEQRVRELFESLGSDEELSAEFRRSPIRVIHEKVFPELPGLSSHETSNADRMLMELLSNDEFIQWAEEWERRHADELSQGELSPERRHELLAELHQRAADIVTTPESLASSEPEHLSGAFGALQTQQFRFPSPPKPAITTLLFYIAAVALVVVIPPVPLAVRPGATRMDLRGLAEILAHR
jgi:hypothetical protein